jgi:protein-S-isoprenylcysteine O-methyltransferase Ste14
MAFEILGRVLLNSMAAMALALLTTVRTVLRTALEDRTLMRELAGYAAYAQRVRYRLVPLVW